MDAVIVTLMGGPMDGMVTNSAEGRYVSGDTDSGRYVYGPVVDGKADYLGEDLPLDKNLDSD